MYQKSLWDEIGMMPDTWDNLRIGGAKLKAKGHPVGISLGHSNDPSTTWRGLLWSYGGAIQDEAGKKIVLNSKATVEATKYVAALYKEAMTADVLSWNDSSNNQYIVSGVGSYIINPISAYRTDAEAEQEAGRRHRRHRAAEGPGEADHGRRVRILRHLEIRQEQGSGEGVPQVLRGELAGSLQGERGLQQSVLRRPRAQADADLVERSDIDPARQAGDPAGLGQVVRHPGLSGPATPAMDEIYYQFILNDMMAKTATGQSSAEDSVKWATRQCEAIMKKWAGKA